MAILQKRGLIGLTVAALMTPTAFGGFMYVYDGGEGLSAEATFTLSPDGQTLNILFTNTSMGVPNGAEASDQILTGISWDFSPGGPGGVEITGGSVTIGAGSQSLNFDTGDYFGGADVSGEWGFSNDDGTGMMQNFVTASRAHATPFSMVNLDGPESIAGPAGGLVASPLPLDLGGQGAIQDTVEISLMLSEAVDDLSFLTDFGTIVEFGSDYRFYEGMKTPAPGALALLALAGCGANRRRRR